MNINDLRQQTLDVAAQTAASNNAAIALAIIYLGDSIREGTSDIGPAIEKVGAQMNAELGSISVSLTDG